MSGLAGIVYTEAGRGVRIEDLAAMRAALGAGAEDFEEIVSGPAGFSGHALSGQIARAIDLPGEDGGLFAIHGTFYDPDFAARLESDDGLRDVAREFLRAPKRLLERIHGEFAIAAWERAGAITVAVDRLRVVPMFWAATDQKLVFSSRLPSLMRVWDDRDIDPLAIVNVAGNSYIPTPGTIFKSVRKLPPGHFLKLSDGQCETVCWWDFDYREQSSASKAELEDETRRLFRESLAARHRVDSAAGEFGAFLSGGVDSSTIVGVLTEVNGGPIKTFSIGFGEEQFNEISYARIAAKRFGSEHQEYFVQPADVVSFVPKLMANLDEPFANASCVPAYYCSKLARDHGVTCLYAGDGGDELFAGNERYATQKLFDYYGMVPGWMRSLVLKPALWALGDVLKLGIAIKGQKYVRRASIPYPQRIYSYDLYNTLPMHELFAPDFMANLGDSVNPCEAIDRHYEAVRGRARAELERQLYIDLKLIISDNDLVKVTRMTEAAGISVRYPFLDGPFAEFSTKIPAPIKMEGRRLRSFFKDTYRGFLPDEVRTKTKHGFGLPIPIWLRSDRELNEMMLDLVLGPTSIGRGYFSKVALEKAVESHRTDRTSFWGTFLWNICILELWHREFADACRSGSKQPETGAVR